MILDHFLWNTSQQYITEYHGSQESEMEIYKLQPKKKNTKTTKTKKKIYLFINSFLLIHYNLIIICVSHYYTHDKFFAFLFLLFFLAAINQSIR